MNKDQSLTALKGMAILGITLVHAHLLIPDVNIYLSTFSHIGQFGCQLFFVLSGYLLVYSWLRCKEQTDSNIKAIKLFYKKRLLKIAPIYLFFVLFYQLLSYYFEYKLQIAFWYKICHSTKNILLNCFLLNGFDVEYFNNIVPGGWFIGTISLFYIIFPFLYNFYQHLANINKYFIYIIPFILCLCSFLIQLIIAVKINSWDKSVSWGFLYHSIINQLPCMAFGMSLSFFKIQNNNINIYEKFNAKMFIVVFLTIITISSFLFFGLHKYPFIYTFTPSLISISFIFLILYTESTYPNWNNSIKKLLEKWGKISFAIYFSNFFGTMFFAWIVVRLLHQFQIIYNPTILYLILLFPMFNITYYLGKIINKLNIFLNNACTSCR